MSPLLVGTIALPLMVFMSLAGVPFLSHWVQLVSGALLSSWGLIGH